LLPFVFGLVEKEQRPALAAEIFSAIQDTASWWP